MFQWVQLLFTFIIYILKTHFLQTFQPKSLPLHHYCHLIMLMRPPQTVPGNDHDEHLMMLIWLPQTVSDHDYHAYHCCYHHYYPCYHCTHCIGAEYQWPLFYHNAAKAFFSFFLIHTSFCTPELIITFLPLISPNLRVDFHACQPAQRSQKTWSAATIFSSCLRVA